jgi:hypothetical protein
MKKSSREVLRWVTRVAVLTTLSRRFAAFAKHSAHKNSIEGVPDGLALLPRRQETPAAVRLGWRDWSAGTVP